MKIRLTILLLSLLMIQGCGSEPSRPVKGNPEKALDNYVQLGLGYLANGNKEQARQNLIRALNIDPDSLLVNDAIALLYQSDGELELAEQHYKKALKIDKNFTQARNNYARFLYMNNRYDEARGQYHIATQDVNYRLRPQAFIGLALSEKKLNNIGAAEAALLRSISLNPRSGGAVLEMVALKLEQREFVNAKGYLDRFENVSRPTPRSLSLGLSLAETFGNKEQQQSYTMALKSLFPNSREARQLALSEQKGKAE